MNKHVKLLTKLRTASNTFPWVELAALMVQLGYEQQERAGSRVRFYNSTTGHLLHLHKPTPGKYD